MKAKANSNSNLNIYKKRLNSPNIGNNSKPSQPKYKLNVKKLTNKINSNKQKQNIHGLESKNKTRFSKIQKK